MNHATPAARPSPEVRPPAQRPEEPLSFDRPHRFLDVGHSKLATWTFGEGPDVVFVHGWPLSSATFRHVVDRLRSDFRCHLVDLPGAGRTKTSSPAAIDLREHAATLRRAIDALGLERYALVGHDSGGFVARALAAGDPRVTGLALSNTEVSGHTPPLLALYLLLSRFGSVGSAALRAAISWGATRRSWMGFGGCFVDPRYADGEFHELFLRPLLESDEALEGALTLLRNADHRTLAGLAAIHARIDAPVLLIWGDADPWFPVEKARAMTREFKGEARLVAIPGGKLFAHEDRADELVEHARPFLASISR